MVYTRLRVAPEGEKAQWLEALERHTIVAYYSVRFLTHWTEAVTAGFAARTRFRHYLHLSDQALLADPVAEVTKLLEFIGLDASAGTVHA